MEPEEVSQEASAALFREALEVMAAQEATPLKRLTASALPVLAVEQVANLRRPQRAEQAREILRPKPTLDADPTVAGVEVTLGALAPRSRRSPERIRLEPRIVRTPERGGDL